jgi:hypothetical protein
MWATSRLWVDDLSDINIETVKFCPYFIDNTAPPAYGNNRCLGALRGEIRQKHITCDKIPAFLRLRRVVHIYHHAEPVINFVNDPKPHIVFALLPSSTNAQTAAQKIATNLQDNIKKTFRTKFILFLSKVTLLNTENCTLHYSGRSRPNRTLGREARFGNLCTTATAYNVSKNQAMQVEDRCICWEGSLGSLPISRISYKRCILPQASISVSCNPLHPSSQNPVSEHCILTHLLYMFSPHSNR